MTRELMPLQEKNLVIGQEIVWVNNNGYITDTGVCITSWIKGWACIDWVRDGLRLYDVPWLRQDKVNIFLKPLCYVEGQPVYKGDVLYVAGETNHLNRDIKIVVSSALDDTIQGDEFNTSISVTFLAKNLSWTKPKTKKSGWVPVLTGVPAYRNVGALAVTIGATPYSTKERVQEMYSANKILDIIEIHWEE